MGTRIIVGAMNTGTGDRTHNMFSHKHAHACVSGLQTGHGSTIVYFICLFITYKYNVTLL